LVYYPQREPKTAGTNKGSIKDRLPEAPRAKLVVGLEKRPFFFLERRCDDLITREKKAQILQHLQEVFPKSNLILLTDFTGLTVAQMRELREKIRERFGDGARYMVVKNTLLRISLEKTGYDASQVEEALHGPTAVLYVTEGDPIEAIKLVYNHIKENKFETFKFKGGFLEGKHFSGEQVEELAKLPSKQELYAMLVGAVQGPIRGLVYALSGITRNLVYVLNAIKEKKSE
jgi:large subunit ribosomal protein L10